MIIASSCHLSQREAAVAPHSFILSIRCLAVVHHYCSLLQFCREKSECRHYNIAVVTVTWWRVKKIILMQTTTPGASLKKRLIAHVFMGVYGYLVPWDFHDRCLMCHVPFVGTCPSWSSMKDSTMSNTAGYLCNYLVFIPAIGAAQFLVESKVI